VDFNLELSDPVVDFLGPEAPWQGIGGEYSISLGRQSTVRPGLTPGLPLMKAGVGAFSRLLFGVLPASSLVVSDNLSADEELIVELDRKIRLPQPHLDWVF